MATKISGRTFIRIKTGKFDETGAKDMRFLMDVLNDADAVLLLKSEG